MTETKTVDCTTERYIAEFRDTERFLAYCRECDNYGKRHGCPPIDAAVYARVGEYERVRIIGVKIVPDRSGLPLSAAHSLMEPVVQDMNRKLLQLEKELGGFACGFVGQCPYCGDAPCARRQGLPCRHPEWVRPSLEALGFDVEKTAAVLLEWEMRWGHDGMLPPWLLLVCGVFF